LTELSTTCWLLWSQLPAQTWLLFCTTGALLAAEAVPPWALTEIPLDVWPLLFLSLSFLSLSLSLSLSLPSALAMVNPARLSEPMTPELAARRKTDRRETPAAMLRTI